MKNIILYMNKEHRKNWTSQEDQVIKGLVKKYGSKKWTTISQKMLEKFPQEHRSGKQCRQRWFNHLNPQINKSPWTELELRALFQAHRKYGNRWRQICKHLPGRTDNAIKNQFYCTLRKSLRRIYRILGTSNSTLRIKKIRPTTLSLMISHYHENYQVYTELKDMDIYSIFADFADDQKYDEIRQKPVSEHEKEKLDKILNLLLEYRDFNKRKASKPKHSRFMRNQQPNIQVQPKVGQLQEIFKPQQKHNQQEQHISEFLLADLQAQQIQVKPQNENSLLNHYQSINKKLSFIVEQQEDPEEKPLTMKRQNSQQQPLKIGHKKQSSLSSERNYIPKQEYSENRQNFNFPFGEPLGNLPALSFKQSHEEPHAKYLEQYDIWPRFSGERTRNRRKKNTREGQQQQNKNENEEISNLFEGFS